MFAYSFLAMTSYNILKPITRSKFISELGADNLPYVLLVAGILIGFIMQGYSRLADLVPRKWVIPAAQAVHGGPAGRVLVPVPDRRGLGVGRRSTSMGLILGHPAHQPVLDARQRRSTTRARRSGSSASSAAAPASAASPARRSSPSWSRPIGTNNLLLVSATLLFVCVGIVVVIIQRRRQHRARGA